jgi:hypothetical protein
MCKKRSDDDTSQRENIGSSAEVLIDVCCGISS